MELLRYSWRWLMGWRRFARLPWSVALAAVFALTGLPAGRAQSPRHSEYEVKAAYLYNFGNFVDWPAKSTGSIGDSFPICVLGQDPFGPALDATVTGETIDAKKVVVRRLSKPQEAINCRIVFISSSEESQLKEIVSFLDKTSVLTVSDMPQFTRRGGMVQFVLEGARVRFEVNLTAAEHAGLRLSSQLLKLAVNTRRTG